MTHPSPTVAILLFTRSAGDEAQHKQFVGGTPDRNAAVAAQLIRHAQATAARTGTTVVCLDSNRQRGATFGERLTGAMQQVFEQGYEQLLVIGNDCPQLDESLLRRAVATLQQGQAVLGPATDGGVYLLGVTRQQFEAAAWQALPWRTAQLGAALRQQLRHAGAAVELLPPLADVDNEQDLARALRQPLPRLLQRRLRRLRPVAPQLRPRRLSVPLDSARRALPRRGPPAS
ncbi:TIGR04282 family arsenosugar biosynthesis glycosyltransferase [Hymenobacter persicinus]|uniref:TIGR04282 family arsenosugar biosynthesis glycosyltransferase n=1 Tax=Hymenobacter persicinus TaxID=2025506 RepID=UPI0013ED81D7|nr:DUF2064 domain-containing protein [Hymenobacter persicinus]